MPRPKTYKPEEVVRRATPVFWRYGYEATSIQQLVDATGVNRFGLYDAFGSKEGLFLAVLDKYRDEMVSQILAPLFEAPRGMPAIRRLFDGMLAFHAGTDDDCGCLMTNTMVDLPSLDLAVRHRVDEHFERMESALKESLEIAKEKGELAADADIDQLAVYLHGIVLACTVVARTGDARDRMRTFVDMALTALPTRPSGH